MLLYIMESITNDSILDVIIKKGPKIDFQERSKMANVPITRHSEKKVNNKVRN